MSFLKALNGQNWAALLARLLIGTLMTMAGWWKVFILGADQHADRFFIQGFTDHWIPDWILLILGYTIPFAELILGLTLLLGLFRLPSLVLVGLLHILTTYGHALQQPLFDIDGHTFTRMALILFLLMLPEGTDKLSVDYWRMRGRERSLERP